jgi:hypothetical protein
LVDANVIKDLYSPVDTVKIGPYMVTVRELRPGGTGVEFYFEIKNTVVSLFAGEELKNVNGVMTRLTESTPGLLQKDSFLGQIYVDYLLKQYRMIISDNDMTGLGFKFWYNNFDKFINHGYKVYVFDYLTDVGFKLNRALSNGAIKFNKIKDKEDLKQFYGKTFTYSEVDYRNFRFAVTR